MRQGGSRLSQSAAAGFTVVETLIVLAIAALILWFALQAAPQLQRNERNNRRKQDVATILSAISRWELNNSGNLPASPADDFLLSATLNIYNRSPIVYGNQSSPQQPVTGIAINIMSPQVASYSTSNSQIDAVHVYNYSKCSQNSSGHSTNAGAGYNDVVALYVIETAGGGTAPKCQQL